MKVGNPLLNVMSADPGAHLQPQARQHLRSKGRRPLLLPAQLRLPMNPAAPFHDTSAVLVRKLPNLFVHPDSTFPSIKSELPAGRSLKHAGISFERRKPCTVETVYHIESKREQKRSADRAVLPQTAALKINMGALMKKLSDQHNSRTLVLTP